MNGQKRSIDKMISEITQLKNRVDELGRLEVNEILDHKQTLKALQQSEDKFYKAFHCCPHIITISSLSDGRYIAVNEAFSSVTNYEQNEVVGRTVEELGIWEVPQERELILNEIELKGSIRNHEMRFRTKTNQLITTLISADQIDIAGDKQLLFVVKDISDRKKME